MVTFHQNGNQSDHDVGVETSDWQDLVSRLVALANHQIPRQWLSVWRTIIAHTWYQKELHKRAYWELVRSRSPLHWIDDVQQEAILFLAKRLQRAADLEGDYERMESSFAAWIVTVIRWDCRHAIARLRRLQQQCQRLVDYSGDERADVDERIDLHHAIRRLEEPFRTVLVLRINGRSVAEIATLLPLERRTVYRVLERGIQVLRRSLGKSDQD